jgi:hypothetical protein
MLRPHFVILRSSMARPRHSLRNDIHCHSERHWHVRCLCLYATSGLYARGVKEGANGKCR